jgi:hypothetical protein
MTRPPRLPAALVGLALALALVAAPREGRAEEPDAGLAVIVGAASNVAGFIVGGSILATRGSNARNNAGWMTIESGFILAPFAAHAVEGEWARGALFATVPAACLGGTGALFDAAPDTFEEGTLANQRVMWALFVVGQAASVVGIVDAAFAPLRARRIVVAPTVGGGRIGLSMGGMF